MVLPAAITESDRNASACGLASLAPAAVGAARACGTSRMIVLRMDSGSSLGLLPKALLCAMWHPAYKIPPCR